VNIDAVHSPVAAPVDRGRSSRTIAGTSPDGTLVEIVELADHPWFVAVQFHPEFKSKPTAAHPLFAGLVAAAVERHAGSAWVTEP
jgi:CTP synthase